ncbi:MULTISPECIES: hypothetical protein [unclassified Bacillus (in: firmicutes)]|uniref:hypothetical protein n=1 Tax=unclassified Bacillus (in: firmicutes) TaxID=185979 RepID=UPI00163B6BCA|nr:MULTISPECIES: hypothetical protein [unclassified Bacillus (in: firmicutes)]QNH48740.1 hypothetical protein H7F25_04500 [Bacillus sp. PAMC28571]QNK43035.1 hypothetical protein H7F24_11065 [Bacillus sp. PAMC22265]
MKRIEPVRLNFETDAEVEAFFQWVRKDRPLTEAEKRVRNLLANHKRAERRRLRDANY